MQLANRTQIAYCLLSIAYWFHSSHQYNRATAAVFLPVFIG
jgi:asparagine N-glycosylation enzyme membrane subunit Stt3